MTIVWEECETSSSTLSAGWLGVCSCRCKCICGPVCLCAKEGVVTVCVWSGGCVWGESCLCVCLLACVVVVCVCVCAFESVCGGGLVCTCVPLCVCVRVFGPVYVCACPCFPSHLTSSSSPPCFSAFCIGSRPSLIPPASSCGLV